MVACARLITEMTKRGGKAVLMCEFSAGDLRGLHGSYCSWSHMPHRAHLHAEAPTLRKAAEADVAVCARDCFGFQSWNNAVFGNVGSGNVYMAGLRMRRRSLRERGRCNDNVQYVLCSKT